MSDPLLSVIVPVYKVEPYLNRCIDSIVSQTYRNLEIILVDDGSPDNCGRICDEYAAKDPRIQVIHQENGGLSAARNSGLDAASGEWYAFVDSDDWIDCDMYKNLISLAETMDADIVESGYRFFRPWKTENKVLSGDDDESIKEYTNIEALQELYFGPQMFGGLAIMVWTKIIRSSLLKDLRFYQGYIHEDTAYTPMALFMAKRIVKFNKTFYTYNIHLGSNSTSGMGVSTLKIKSSLFMSEQTRRFFEKNYVEGVTEYLLRRSIETMVNAYCDYRFIEKRYHIRMKDGSYCAI